MIRSLLLLLLCAVTPGVSAQALPLASSPAETTIASRGGVDLTLGDIDAKLASLPADARFEYLGDRQRVVRMIDTLLLAKQIAADGEKAGLDKTPEFTAGMELKRRELLMNMRLEQHMRSFSGPDLELLAREKYLSNPDAFRPKPQVDVRHILISLEGRDEAAALKLAQTVRERLDNGEDFLALVDEYMSSTDGTGGRGLVPNIDFNKLDKQFAIAVGQLKAVGDITGPVRTQFGYHLIRLERFEEFERPSFEQVRSTIIDQLRKDIESAERSRFLSSFSKQPTELRDDVVRQLAERYLSAD